MIRQLDIQPNDFRQIAHGGRMQFVYPAKCERTARGEIVVSFRDLPECLTSGTDESDALAQASDALGERRVGRATRWASDALEEAIAGRIADSDPIPTPRAPRAGERDVPVPPGMAAKAALVVAFRESSLTRAELAKLLGLHEKAVRRLMDPRHDAPADRIDAVLRVLGSQIIIETA